MKNKTLQDFIAVYLQNHPLFFSFIRPQEAFLFHKYKKYLHSPILDFGCGDGFFAETVFGEHFLDTGLDIETERTKEALATHVYKKVLYYDGNIIPLKTKTQSTVISNCVLEHIPDLKKSLHEVYRVLRPGGYFLTSVMADKWEEYQAGAKVLGPLYKKFMRKRQVHHNLLSAAQWRAVFEEVGFTITEEVGYVSKTNGFWLDIAHYLSIPSLITRLLFHKWVLSPALYKKLQTASWIEKKIQIPVPATKSAAIFYVLRK